MQNERVYRMGVSYGNQVSVNNQQNNSTTGSIMITDLHEKLFSHVEYGQYAREYRKDT